MTVIDGIQHLNMARLVEQKSPPQPSNKPLALQPQATQQLIGLIMKRPNDTLYDGKKPGAVQLAPHILFYPADRGQKTHRVVLELPVKRHVRTREGKQYIKIEEMKDIELLVGSYPLLLRVLQQMHEDGRQRGWGRYLVKPFQWLLRFRKAPAISPIALEKDLFFANQAAVLAFNPGKKRVYNLSRAPNPRDMGDAERLIAEAASIQ